MTISTAQYNAMRGALRGGLSSNDPGAANPSESEVLGFFAQLFAASSGSSVLGSRQQAAMGEAMRTVLTSNALAGNPSALQVTDFVTQLAADSSGASPLVARRYSVILSALRDSLSVNYPGTINPSEADVLSYFSIYGVSSFNGNLSSAFTAANILQAVQTDLGLTYGVTPKATAGNTSSSVITLSGSLGASAVAVPVLAKATSTASVGAGATFSISYDGGTTFAMTGVTPTAATPVALTGSGAGLSLAWSAGTSVTNDTWKACCAGLSDQTGNGKHYVQATVTKQPVIVPGPNGFPSLQFDGVDDSLQSTIVFPAPGTTPTWTYSIWRQDTWTLNSALFGSPAGEFTMRLLEYTVTPYLSLAQSTSTVSSAKSAPAIGQYSRLIAGWTNSASDGIRWGGGADVFGLCSGNVGNTGNQLGSQFGTAQASASTLLAFLAFNSKPSAAQLAAADAIISTKYAGLVAVSRLAAGTGASSSYPLTGFNSANTSWFADTPASGNTLTGTAPNQYYTKDHYARARVLLPGTDTALTVEAVSIGSGSSDLVGVWTTTDSTGASGWTYNQTITYTGYGAKQQIGITLPVGTRCVDLTENAYITGVSASSFAIAPVTDVASSCVVYGDSIADGVIASPTFLGYAQLFRYGGKFSAVKQFSVAGSSLYTDSGGGVSVATLAAQLVARVADGTSRTLYIQKGTNDYGLDLWNAASFQTWYGNLLDAVHALDSTISIVCQTLFHRQTEGAQTTFLSTWADFNTSITNAANARSSFCRVIVGANAFSQAQIIADGGLHPLTATHAQAYAWLQTQF